MRYIILIALIISSFQFTQAQRIPSNCETQDSVKYSYTKDAAYLSILELFRQGSPYSDSIPFPDSLLEKKLRALIAVYNVAGIPEADTIAHLKPVHDYFAYPVRKFYIRAYENLFWMQNLKNQQVPCGQPVLDSLLLLYNITEYVYDNLSVFGRNFVMFTIPTWLNTEALARELNRQPDIEAHTSGVVGDGPQIQDSVFTDHIELTYSHGWGDCPAGCAYRRFWKFKVYEDCSVEFAESYGGTLPLGVPAKIAKEIWKVFPNPFSHTIEIGNMYEPFGYALYAIDGGLLKEGTLNGSRITDLDFLPKGLYILHLQAQDSRQVFRISKE